MYCSRRLYKGNAYEICLPIADTGITVVRFYTRGDIIIEKEPETTGDSMCFSFTEEDLASLEDGVLRYGYDDFDTNSPYVVVTPGDYSGSTLDDLLEDAYDSGYTAGQEDCSGGTCEGVWESGYTSGFTDGVESVPTEPLRETITENGDYAYAPLEGYYRSVNLTVDVPQTGYTQEDLDNAYASGYTAGIEDSICSAETIYPAMPLTFGIISGGTIVWKTNDSSLTKTIEYNLNCGGWSSITSTTGGTEIAVNPGDVLQLRGDNPQYATGQTTGNNTFCGSTAVFEVYGNIMSLIHSTGFSTAKTLPSAYTFTRLFYGCDGLASAENLVLPATTLKNYCYNYMFARCEHLVSAPKLPATRLTNNCYRYMFQACVRLAEAPVLPAMTMKDSCYYGMLQGCQSLTTAPELPATTLANACYSWMFDGCRFTEAPELPATTLAQNCYSSMFRGCINLIVSPVLPASVLEASCYSSMFQNCSNLNYITCLATDISAYLCLSGWHSGVSETGTFVKNPAMTSWPSGSAGIPTGWTVVDAT